MWRVWAPLPTAPSIGTGHWRDGGGPSPASPRCVGQALQEVLVQLWLVLSVN